jgi:hypothetical protein
MGTLIASLGMVALFAATPLSAQSRSGAAKAQATKAPMATDGHPDLSGIWTNATITPIERPAKFAGKPTVTDAEAAAYEQSEDRELKAQDGQSDGPLIRAAGSSGTGGYNVLFVDRGNELARVDGVKRTSLIVDPPDGKRPAITKEGQARLGKMFASFNNYDNVKVRPLSERCIIGFSSTSGPPMMPVLYNNTYQFVQTKDHLMILVEMVHDVRIIRMNGTHKPSNVRTLLGDSIGHWEGDTLVVETTNIREDNAFFGASENLKVIERFRRISPDTILYRATIDDPSTYARPWTMEFPFNATPGPVYEYACHEGNYAMNDILGGARKQEAEAGKK